MNLYPILRPLLLRLDPEFTHRLAVSWLKLQGWRQRTADRLTQDLMLRELDRCIEAGERGPWLLDAIAHRHGWKRSWPTSLDAAALRLANHGCRWYLTQYGEACVWFGATGPRYTTTVFRNPAAAMTLGLLMAMEAKQKAEDGGSS